MSYEAIAQIYFADAQRRHKIAQTLAAYTFLNTLFFTIAGLYMGMIYFAMAAGISAIGHAIAYWLHQRAQHHAARICWITISSIGILLGNLIIPLSANLHLLFIAMLLYCVIVISWKIERALFIYSTAVILICWLSSLYLNQFFSDSFEMTVHFAQSYFGPLMLTTIGLFITVMLMSLMQKNVRQDITIERIINEQKDNNQRLADALTRSEKYRLEAELANSKNQAKDDFLASMSHETRTPVTTILGYCGELLDEVKNPNHRASLKHINTAGKSLLALLNDILDVSKIESSTFTVDQQPFSMSRILHEVELNAKPLVEDKGLNFTIDQPKFEYKLLGDHQRISQILLNLINNAIKFTEQGSVKLTCEILNNELHCHVTDTGLGIKAENLDRLFQRFEQEETSISRRFGGVGLGLYIASELAKAMGGNITVTSEINKGSTFTLTLPYRPTKEADKQPTNPDMCSINLLSLEGRVLLAEDTEVLQMLIKRLIEKTGAKVTTVDNGQQALDVLEEQTFDLILMDMQMPIMDGLEATTRLRQQGISTPVYGITANVMQKHRDAFATAGSEGIIEKPIEKEQLYAVLSRHLPGKG